MTPFIIPVFISHKGCPHRCVFCNQESITGRLENAADTATPEAVQLEIEHWLKRPGAMHRPVQVAFYGGSFTGLPADLQDRLLTAVKPFMDSGRVQAIRLSTRPDYIDDRTPDFLWRRGVRIVELGIQSLEPQVLTRSKRGHSVAQVRQAFARLKKSPLQIGAQLMTGLPGETTAGAVQNAGQLAGLHPDFVRIYPVLVVRGSALERMYHQRKYRPQSLNRAVVMTARLKAVFDGHGIPVIRMGLQPSDDLSANVIAGPYHAAFGELVQSRLLFKKVRAGLQAAGADGERQLLLAAADQSIFRGQKNYYWRRLHDLGLLHGVEVIFDRQQPRGSVRIIPT